MLCSLYLLACTGTAPACTQTHIQTKHPSHKIRSKINPRNQQIEWRCLEKLTNTTSVQLFQDEPLDDSKRQGAWPISCLCLWFVSITCYPVSQLFVSEDPAPFTLQSLWQLRESVVCCVYVLLACSAAMQPCLSREHDKLCSLVLECLLTWKNK